MAKYNTDDIKTKNPLETVVSNYVDLKPNGRDFLGCCPFHDEKTPSFHVNVKDDPVDSFYYCYGCGASGGVIDFTMEWHNVEFKEACAILGGEKTADMTSAPKKTKALKDSSSYYDGLEYLPTDSVIKVGQPVNLMNPKRDFKVWNDAKPEAVYPYYKDGAFFGYVLRFVIGGDKITPMVRHTQHGWTICPFGDDRPVYRLPDVSANPNAQLLIVEGEKAKDAATAVTSAVVSISWSGGSKGIKYTDWSILAGRRIVMIPDNDTVGYTAMREIALEAEKHGAESIKFVIPPRDLPKGWDVADKQWGDGELIQWCKGHASETLPWFDDEEREKFEKKHGKKPEDVEPPPIDDLPPAYDLPPATVYEVVPSNDDAEEDNTPHYEPPDDASVFDAPYKILGHYNGNRYYMPDATRQIVELSPSSHSSNNLLQLAPLSHWEAVFPGKSSVDWTSAVNAMLQLSAKAGLFNADRIRGRGAWIDQGRAVIHMGGELYVDGEHIEPERIDSRFIYPQDIDLGLRLVDPAGTKDAHALFEICKSLSWENTLSGTLLTGWCVVAPLAGMLKWRPHIWVTGPAGSGKSTVLDSIVAMMLGDIALKGDGTTTEAGIRQMLGADARPVLCDEMDTNNRKGQDRIQSILELSRVSSSGGQIAKGSATGGAAKYHARAAFCFSSINTNIKEYADESRISRLILVKDTTKDPSHYEELAAKIISTITPEYSSRMFSRSVSFMATLQKNCDTFTEAAALFFKSRRIADQIGAMLAGAFLCHSTKEIKKEEAIMWMSQQTWEDHTVVSAKSACEQLLETIASHRCRVVTERGVIDITLGEAIEASANRNADLNYCVDECEKELRRTGIKVEEGMVYIANKAEPLTKLLRDTAWQTDWTRTLSECDNAQKTAAIRFSPGIVSRAIAIPVSCVID